MTISRSGGVVELTIRESVYDHLRGVLRRYTLCEERSADYEWLVQFIADLEKGDTERHA